LTPPLPPPLSSLPHSRLPMLLISY
jgi:hypothetical protein